MISPNSNSNSLKIWVTIIKFFLQWTILNFHSPLTLMLDRINDFDNVVTILCNVSMLFQRLPPTFYQLWPTLKIRDQNLLQRRCSVVSMLIHNVEATFQRCINVVSTFWINDERTFSDVESETKFEVGLSTLHNVDTTSEPDKQHRNNIFITLYRRCFNLSSTLLKLHWIQLGYW